VALLEDAAVTVLVADYVGVDAANKLNLIGAGFTLLGAMDPVTGATNPFALAVLIEAPVRYVGQDVAVTIELRDETSDTAVQMAGPTGQAEALRISQLVRFEKVMSPPGMTVPEGLPTRLQFNVGFSNGLPLKPGALYAWRVSLDGQTRKQWAARFAIPGPPPGPVFGGPAGPADIPNIQQPGAPGSA
jgi:hypothetical protein